MATPLRAIVIGGTGSTGRELVRELISSSRVAKVTSLVRRVSDVQNDKYLLIIRKHSPHLSMHPYIPVDEMIDH